MHNVCMKVPFNSAGKALLYFTAALTMNGPVMFRNSFQSPHSRSNPQLKSHQTSQQTKGSDRIKAVSCDFTNATSHATSWARQGSGNGATFRGHPVDCRHYWKLGPRTGEIAESVQERQISTTVLGITDFHKISSLYTKMRFRLKKQQKQQQQQN